MADPITRSGSNASNARDANRVPAVGAVLASDGKTVNPLELDGSGNLLVNVAAGGAGGTQYTDGGVPPAHPVGNTIEWSDGANWQTVSTAKPLPVTASVTITNPTIGAAVPATANYIAGNRSGNLTGLLIGSQTSANSVGVVLASDQASVPVAATLSAETTKVIGTVNISASQTIAVTNTGTFAVQSTPVTQADTFMLGGVNIKEINGVTPLMGSGVMGTGSPRVTIASDNDPLIVKQATAANLNATVVGSIGSASNAINVGQQTVSTSAVQISATATVPTNGILVQAISTNGASIFVGGSGVTTSNGWELQPGQAIAFTCTLNTIYIISAASTTDKVCYQVV